MKPSKLDAPPPPPATSPPIADGVLVVMAHPAFERSRANRAMTRVARGVKGVKLHDLYERYPDFNIDVRAEQALLTRHKTIVLQYPVYWYATPALLKEWLDLVWLHGFAYGRGGDALKGKRLMVAVSTGGGPEAYQEGGMHGFPIDTFLKPMEQTAVLCGMAWEKPFIIHGASVKAPKDLAAESERFNKRLTALAEKAARK